MEKSYLELLKDPRWQKKRLKIMERDNFTCQMCSDTHSTLTVHHKRYVWGRKPWEYTDKDLITFCEDCHSLISASIIDDNYKIVQKQNLGGYWIYIAVNAWDIEIIEKTSAGEFRHIAAILGGTLSSIVTSMITQQKELRNEKK